jgi:hypothetical protein
MRRVSECDDELSQEPPADLKLGVRVAVQMASSIRLEL